MHTASLPDSADGTSAHFRDTGDCPPSADRAIDLFFELFSGLPRQGPGSAAGTARALALVPPLPPSARILDVGCGTGAQTIDLARATPAAIHAVELHEPFVRDLAAKVRRLSLDGRIFPSVGDMRHLAFPPAHFDLIWCEGAIYIMGFDAGLEAWRPYLREDGHIAVTEACWFTAEPPHECREFWDVEYPAIRSIDANRAAVRRCGYELVGDFRLPASAWWDDYYLPICRNLESFRKRHPGDEAAATVAAQTEREIEMFRRYSDAYGYVFFVMRVTTLS